MKFKVFVADFVEGCDSRWRFLQVKAFELRDEIYQPASSRRPSKQLKKENLKLSQNEEEEDGQNTLGYDYAEEKQLKSKMAHMCSGEYCNELIRLGTARSDNALILFDICLFGISSLVIDATITATQF